MYLNAPDFLRIRYSVIRHTNTTITATITTTIIRNRNLLFKLQASRHYRSVEALMKKIEN